jgi:hypothetical protein
MKELLQHVAMYETGPSNDALAGELAKMRAERDELIAHVQDLHKENTRLATDLQELQSVIAHLEDFETQVHGMQAKVADAEEAMRWYQLQLESHLIYIANWRQRTRGDDWGIFTS